MYPPTGRLVLKEKMEFIGKKIVRSKLIMLIEFFDNEHRVLLFTGMKGDLPMI